MIELFIPVYPEKITKDQLELILGEDNRTIRLMIADARLRGEMICNEQDGSGYYMTNETLLLRKQVAQMRSRAGSLFKQIQEFEKNILAIDSLKDYEDVMGGD